MVDDLDQESRAAEWREMAERLRGFAETIGNPLACDNLTHLARQWEQLAERIERQKPVKF
jgi:hypothetical protein